MSSTSISAFEELGVSPVLAETLARHGITEPSPIQRQAIPAVLDGRDMLAQSQTGTGKTLAYLLPLLTRIDAEAKELQAIVLAPTRELGVQIAAEIEKYGGPAGIRGQALIGGASISRQVDRLKLHPHIVVGTPGRIVELLRLRKLKLHRVRSIVIDEADQMFALGGAKEAEEVIEGALRDRQLLFFSATLPGDVRRMAGRWMKEPAEIEIDPGQRTASGIEHLVFVCEERDRIDTLRRLLRLYEPRSALAFVNDLDLIAEVAEKLKFAGLSVEALYGDAPKQERTTLLGRFRAGKVRTLLATDVAARGLDIEGLTHVFHLQPALDADHYVHRAGRTGRMGRNGWSVSIATPQELFILRKFEKQLGIVIREKAMYKGEVVEPNEVRPNKARTGSEGVRRGSYVKTSALGGETKRAEGSRADRAERNGQGHVQGRGPGQPQAQGKPKSGQPSRPRLEAGSTEQEVRRPPKSGAHGEHPAARPQPEGGAARKRDKERERVKDRKNKGAPRWLKEKRDQGSKS